MAGASSVITAAAHGDLPNPADAIELIDVERVQAEAGWPASMWRRRCTVLETTRSGAGRLLELYFNRP
jgi:hypothetical protein